MSNKCRICKSSNLICVISLGNQKNTSVFQKYGEHNKTNTFPVNLSMCKDCGLIQMEESVPQDSMYKNNTNV